MDHEIIFIISNRRDSSRNLILSEIQAEKTERSVNRFKEE